MSFQSDLFYEGDKIHMKRLANIQQKIELSL